MEIELFFKINCEMVIWRQFSGKSITYIGRLLNISYNGTKIKFLLQMVKSSHVEVSKGKIWSITILKLQWVELKGGYNLCCKLVAFIVLQSHIIIFVILWVVIILMLILNTLTKPTKCFFYLILHFIYDIIFVHFM